jgi:hypothetical protein
MRTPDVAPYRWDDPSTPLTIPNMAGRRALVDVATPGGLRPFGFTVAHEPEAGKLTVSWPGIVCAGDHLTQETVPAPPGPLLVSVITPA